VKLLYKPTTDCTIKFTVQTIVFQATEAELTKKVERLSERCRQLDASLQAASNETEELRVKLLGSQPLNFASEANQPLHQTLQQRVAANKVGYYVNFCFIRFL